MYSSLSLVGAYVKVFWLSLKLYLFESSLCQPSNVFFRVLYVKTLQCIVFYCGVLNEVLSVLQLNRLLRMFSEIIFLQVELKQK